MIIPGFTSTGSKRPEALFGAAGDAIPLKMTRSQGCTIWDEGHREYTDFVMALGAVALGYNHPDVTRAATDAIARGGVGSLAPVEEEELGSMIAAMMPSIEQVRFLKTGAEAAAAAVRIARTHTGRDSVVACGYHGWLDWCSDAAGVPASTRAHLHTVPFNDCDRARDMIRRVATTLACVIVEPVIEEAPTVEWLTLLRDETHRAGAVLIFDEIKTAFRLGLGGAAGRWGVAPDLTILGKALANGYPLAAVGGSAEVMDKTNDTWISSTLATEFISLAAAQATLSVMQRYGVPAHLAALGSQLLAGLRDIASRHCGRGITASGIPEMCYLRYGDQALSGRVATACAERGLLFKRSAYNFVSLAHTPADIANALATLDEVLTAC